MHAALQVYMSCYYKICKLVGERAGLGVSVSTKEVNKKKIKIKAKYSNGPVCYMTITIENKQLVKTVVVMKPNESSEIKGLFTSTGFSDGAMWEKNVIEVMYRAVWQGIYKVYNTPLGPIIV